MKITYNTTTEFVPKWMDNKDSEKPIVIHHKTPTMKLYNELLVKPVLVIEFDKNMEQDGGRTETTIDNTKLVRNMVTKIENLVIEVDGKDQTFKTVDDIFAEDAPAILSGLVDEIGAHLQKLLTRKDVDQKN